MIGRLRKRDKPTSEKSKDEVLESVAVYKLHKLFTAIFSFGNKSSLLCQW